MSATPAGPITAYLGPVAGEGLGARATIVLVSSSFCAPCRAARAVTQRVAAGLDGVRQVEVDVAGHEALAERLEVRRTPTVVVLDPAGMPRARVEGVPRLAWLRAAVLAASG